MTNLKMNVKNVEILAPCGTYETLIAAIRAGADACYLGGNRFGARAYAENFDEEALLSAISYAHLHGVKIYLTVNTLIKEQELEELSAYLRPLYEAGLDAVIVQDLGAFSLIRQEFPDLPIHCSTQMNITSVYGAKLMERQGASRVVTAREMSLEEIAAIKQATKLEVETFVHGAMCYSYSGQCLMSSLAGGRSGNRGRCAQPCRKCYDGEYLLSMKDMCAIEDIPKLLAVGVDSFKIEGRMKNAAYVASAVHAYRTVTDACLSGKFDERQAEEFSFELANVFNRGGFSKGYFHQKNGEDMVCLERPNNMGVVVGTLVGVEAGCALVKLDETLYPQDVLELTTRDGEAVELTTGIGAEAGETVSLKCQRTRELALNSAVCRTRCNEILGHIKKDYVDGGKALPLSARLNAHVGEALSLTVNEELFGREYTGLACGEPVEAAMGHAVDKEAYKKPLMQLGNTDYELRDLALFVDENAFVPLGALKKLRRDAIANLEHGILDDFKRMAQDAKKEVKAKTKAADAETSDVQNHAYTVFVSNEMQLAEVLEHQRKQAFLTRIVIPPALYSAYMDRRDDSMEQVELFVGLPHIVREGFSLDSYLPKGPYQGIYIRNMDGLAAVLAREELREKSVILAPSVYCYNHMARDFFRELFSDFAHLTFELPRELSLRELKDLSGYGDMIFTCYEYQPVMLTANCVKKTREACDKSNGLVIFADEEGHCFFAKCECEDCYNVIYNGISYDVIDKKEELFGNAFSLHFTICEKEQVRYALTRLTRQETEAEDAENTESQVNARTSGHLFRGVM